MSSNIKKKIEILIKKINIGYKFSTCFLSNIRTASNGNTKIRNTFDLHYHP